MAELHYIAIASLDGYISDPSGSFDWSVPDEEVHAFVNALEAPLRTHLYGRRLYEVMTGWETMPTGPDEPRVVNEFAASWRAARKLVFSRTLRDVGTARTSIHAELTPALLQALKIESDSDLSIGGAQLAGQAISWGLVDHLHLLLSPVLVGGGTPALPRGVSVPLELQEQRAFSNGVVYLRYGAQAPT